MKYFYYPITITANNYDPDVDKFRLYHTFVEKINKHFKLQYFEFTFENTKKQKHSQLHLHGVIQSRKRLTDYLVRSILPRATHIDFNNNGLTDKKNFDSWVAYCNKEQEEKDKICKFIKPPFCNVPLSDDGTILNLLCEAVGDLSPKPQYKFNLFDIAKKLKDEKLNIV